MYICTCYTGIWRRICNDVQWIKAEESHLCKIARRSRLGNTAAYFYSFQDSGSSYRTLGKGREEKEGRRSGQEYVKILAIRLNNTIHGIPLQFSTLAYIPLCTFTYLRVTSGESKVGLILLTKVPMRQFRLVQ